MLFLPTACGYRFPNQPQPNIQTSTDSTLQNSLLHITGSGSNDNPRLTFLLREKLQTQLGLNRHLTQKTEGVPILEIQLQPVERTLLSEDHSGRANQYRIVIRAKPILKGSKNAPLYPLIQASTSYYEPRISASVQATRMRAETEAMERLADALTAVLSSDFQPKP